MNNEDEYSYKIEVKKKLYKVLFFKGLCWGVVLDFCLKWANILSKHWPFWSG